MKMIARIGISLSLLTTQMAFAHSLSLDSAVAEAIQVNPELKRLEATSERLSWTKLEALSGYLPHISADYEHFFSAKYMRQNIVFGGNIVNFPAAYPQDMLSLDFSLTVFDGLYSFYQFRAANLSTEAAELDLSRAKFKLEAEVRSNFYRAIAAQKLLDVAKQNVKTLEDHLSTAKLTEKTGYGTRFDVLRIEANLEEARAEADQAEDNVILAREALSEVMGFKSEDTRPLEGNLPVLKETLIPRDLTLSVEDRQDVQAQARREAATDERRAAARAFWMPSISLFAREQFYKYGDFDPIVLANSSFQNASGAGIRLTWNLFDGGASLARQQQAIAASHEAKNEISKTLTELPREFSTWKRQFFHNISLYRARLRALEQSQESVRIATAGVRAGTQTNTEVLDAELDLFRARGGLIRAQIDSIDALGKLELALGRRLWSNEIPH